MGIFNNIFGGTAKAHDLSDLKEQFNRYAKHMDSETLRLARESWLNEVEEFELGTSSFPITDEEEFREFMTTVLYAMDTYDLYEDPRRLNHFMDDACEIYTLLCPFKNETEGYNYLFKLFVNIFGRNGIYANGLFSTTLYTAFADKKNYFDIMNMIIEEGLEADDLTNIENFVSRANALCASESVLKSNVISFIRLMPTSANVEDLIERSISDLEKYAGIYHIDKYLLAQLDAKINGANSIFSRLDKLTLSIDEELKAMEDETEKSAEVFEGLKKDKLFELKAKIEEFERALRLTHNDLIRQSKRDIKSASDDLLREFEAKLAGYNKILDDFSANAEETVRAIVTKLEADGKVSRGIFSDVETSAQLKKLLEALKDNPELLSGISTTKVVSTSEPVVAGSQVVTPISVAPAIIIPEKTGLLKAFDRDIPYKDRYKMVMEAKERDIAENGSIYHEKTDDIIAFLLSGVSPYLYGPSQCGKTFNVNQICKLLGLPVRQIGKINEEFNVVGFNTATGVYSRTNFRDAYECGFAAFVDEIDSGDQNATLILNEFVGAPLGSSYAFPDGVVDRHPNFILIAAGNTDGSGKNFAYSSRHKLDESLLQRLKKIYYGYDPRIEQKATEGIEEWYEFTQEFRRALDVVSGNSVGTGRNANIVLGNVTTKDLFVIREWIMNKQFGKDTVAKTIFYQYIENQTIEKLASLVEAMSDFYSTERPSSKLYKSFVKQTTDLRTRGR